MSKQEIMVGSTDKTLYFHIRKKSDGTPLTGLVFNSTNLQSYYQRDLAAPVQIPLVTQTVTGVHTDGGFNEVDATNTPGLYRLDVPDAAFITGVDCVRVYINEVTTTALGISVDPAEIQLTTFEKSDPTSIDRLVNIDEATSPSEISDYMDANSVQLALIDLIKAVTDVIPDSGAMTSKANEATLTEMKGATFSGATDSLEAIRARGDAAWLTGAGGSSPTVEQIRTEMDTNSTKLDVAVSTRSSHTASDVATAVWNFIVENGKTAVSHLNKIKAVLSGNSQTNGTEFLDDEGVNVITTVAADENKNRTWS